jgi:transposase-like protein
MPKQKASYTPEEKVAILRRHLLDKVAVSSLCEEHGLHPNTFYLWQKTFFENGAAAFRTDSAPKAREEKADKQRIAALEAKLTRKHEVLSELMEEHIRLKKELGEP